MPKLFSKKVRWYLRKFLNLCIVSIQLLIYFFRHPKKTVYNLFVPIIQAINEFHQATHSKLFDFSETRLYQEIKKDVVFSANNVFNIDANITRPRETMVISTFVRHLQPKNIFEIGTYYGFTCRHMAINSPPDCTIYTLDLPLKDEREIANEVSRFPYSDYLVVQLSRASFDKRIYKNTPEEYNIRELFGNSMEFDFSPYYGKMDLIFIDGNHTYSFIKSDTEHAFKMLSPQGVIVWHDFDYIYHRGIFGYLNQLCETHKIFAIPKTRLAIYGPQIE